MALIHGRVGGKEVQIAAALNVIDPCAGSPLDNHIEWMIVMRAVLSFDLDQLGCEHGKRPFSADGLMLHAGVALSSRIRARWMYIPRFVRYMQRSCIYMRQALLHKSKQGVPNRVPACPRTSPKLL